MKLKILEETPSSFTVNRDKIKPFKGKVHVWYLLKTNTNLKTDLVTSHGELLIV